MLLPNAEVDSPRALARKEMTRLFRRSENFSRYGRGLLAVQRAWENQSNQISFRYGATEGAGSLRDDELRTHPSKPATIALRSRIGVWGKGHTRLGGVYDTVHGTGCRKVFLWV